MTDSYSPKISQSRLIVGEVRNTQVSDMLEVINRGHPGGWANIHALAAQGLHQRMVTIEDVEEIPPHALERSVPPNVD